MVDLVAICHNSTRISSMEITGRRITNVTTEIRAMEATSGARQLAADLKSAGETGQKVLPFSAKRWQRFAGATRENVIFLSLEEHRQILEHSIEDQVILVETGISLAALDEYLSRTRQWLPLSFASTSDTLLEAIVTGDGGALSYGFGGPRHLVLGLTVALSNGHLIRTGGRVVKNVTGYDLTRLIIGSYGIFGVPVAAYLRLYARPDRFLSVAVADSDPLRLLALERSAARLGLPLVCAELIDKRLLGEAKDDGQRFLLLFRLAGAQALIEAARPLLLDLCNEHGRSTTPFDKPEEEAEIWSSLTKAQRNEEAFLLELAINRQSFAKLWQQERALFDCPFSVVLGLGAAKLFLPGLPEQAKIIAALTAFAEANSQALTVAYSDADYLRRVRRLGSNVSRQNQLLERLKKQFDPSNCLNPFVCLAND
jgi:FAD/FMN-containing dehydrogenase